MVYDCRFSKMLLHITLFKVCGGRCVNVYFATFMYPVSSYFEFDAIFSVCRCHLTLHLALT